jgi:ligand-binding SRPBCC domain-containing protein
VTVPSRVRCAARRPGGAGQRAHTFERAQLGGGTLVREMVTYELPFGPLGALAHTAFVRRDLDKIFDYRRDAVARILG